MAKIRFALPRTKWLIGTAVTIAVVLAIVVVALYVMRRMRANIEGFKADKKDCDKDYKLMLFEMDGCPHCINFKPEWQRCVAHLRTDKTYGGKVCMVIVTAEDVDKCKSYGIDGFPTVILEEVKTGKRVDFNGPRTLTGLQRFLSENVK